MNNNAVAVRENNNEELATLTLAAYAQDFETKIKICTMLWKSGVLPESVKSPEAVFALVMMGQEYGFSPIKSCELFDHIKGRACMRTQGMHAKALQHGGSFKTVKSTPIECEVKATRFDRTGKISWEETTTFNIAQARDAGLLGKDVWKNYPQDMLWNRCVSRLCKHGWPDILAGIEPAENMRDLEAIDITPVANGASKVEVLPAVGAAPFPDDGSKAAVKEAMGEDDLPFGNDPAPAAEPAAAPAPAAAQEPEVQKVWYYDMNLSYRFMNDNNYKEGTKKALAKKGKEIALNVWEVNKELSPLAECLVLPQHLEKAIEEANNPKQ